MEITYDPDFYPSIYPFKEPVSIYQRGGGGGGCWAILGMKKKIIYESKGDGHKYDFHFLFWHQNALASGEPPVLSFS